MNNIENNRMLLILSKLEISIKKVDALLKLYNGKIAKLHTEITKNTEKLHNILEQQDICKIQTACEQCIIDVLEEKLERNNVGYLTILDDSYPKRLRQISNPPYVIYYKGDVSILDDECIGVVGTRKPNTYGKEVSEKFVTNLAKEDFCIVSGLAYGVDTIAHSVALKNKAKTIAVLACGLDIIYPAENRSLAEQIVLNGGCLVSEYFIETPPESFRFPNRNRIISGISMGVLVTQAAEKSGSLITARCALEQFRNLFVIPASLNVLESKGTNLLLNSIPESIVINTDKIVLAFRERLNQKQDVVKIAQLGIEETSICEALRNGEKSFDELLEVTDLNPKILNQKLTSLEISGIIKRLSGNYYSIGMENL